MQNIPVSRRVEQPINVMGIDTQLRPDRLKPRILFALSFFLISALWSSFLHSAFNYLNSQSLSIEIFQNATDGAVRTHGIRMIQRVIYPPRVDWQIADYVMWTRL